MHRVSFLHIVLTACIALSQADIHEVADKKGNDYLVRLKEVGVPDTNIFTSLFALSYEKPNSTIAVVRNKFEWKLVNGSLTMEGVYTLRGRTYNFNATLIRFDFELYGDSEGGVKVVKREFHQVTLDSVVPTLRGFLERLIFNDKLKSYMQIKVAEGFKVKLQEIIDDPSSLGHRQTSTRQPSELNTDPTLSDQ